MRRCWRVAALLAVMRRECWRDDRQMLLPWWISAPHATLAELFFSTTVAIALFTSRWWLAGASHLSGRCAISDSRPLARRAALRSGPALRGRSGAPQSHRRDLPYLRRTDRDGRGTLGFHANSASLRAEHELRDWLRVDADYDDFFAGLSWSCRVHEPNCLCRSPQPMPLMVTFTVLHVAVGALTMAASVVSGNPGSPQSGRTHSHFAPPMAA